METWKLNVTNNWFIIDYNRQSLDKIMEEKSYRVIDKMFRTTCGCGCPSLSRPSPPSLPPALSPSLPPSRPLSLCFRPCLMLLMPLLPPLVRLVAAAGTSSRSSLASSCCEPSTRRAATCACRVPTAAPHHTQHTRAAAVPAPIIHPSHSPSPPPHRLLTASSPSHALRTLHLAPHRTRHLAPHRTPRRTDSHGTPDLVSPPASRPTSRPPRAVHVHA